MINSNERIIKHKIGLLNLAEELGNVSQACKMMGAVPSYFLSLQKRH